MVLRRRRLEPERELRPDTLHRRAPHLRDRRLRRQHVRHLALSRSHLREQSPRAVAPRLRRLRPALRDRARQRRRRQRLARRDAESVAVHRGRLRDQRRVAHRDDVSLRETLRRSDKRGVAGARLRVRNVLLRVLDRLLPARADGCVSLRRLRDARPSAARRRLRGACGALHLHRDRRRSNSLHRSDPRRVEMDCRRRIIRGHPARLPDHLLRRSIPHVDRARRSVLQDSRRVPRRLRVAALQCADRCPADALPRPLLPLAGADSRHRRCDMDGAQPRRPPRARRLDRHLPRVSSRRRLVQQLGRRLRDRPPVLAAGGPVPRRPDDVRRRPLASRDARPRRPLLHLQLRGDRGEPDPVAPHRRSALPLHLPAADHRPPPSRHAALPAFRLEAFPRPRLRESQSCR
jgi:hypothetical protein